MRQRKKRAGEKSTTEVGRAQRQWLEPLVSGFSSPFYYCTNACLCIKAINRDFASNTYAKSGIIRDDSDF